MQNEEGNEMMLAGIGVACLTALGFVYGFQEDNTDALRATRNLPPRAEASIAATEGMRQQQFAMETFPTTVVTGEAPVGECDHVFGFHSVHVLVFYVVYTCQH